MSFKPLQNGAVYRRPYHADRVVCRLDVSNPFRTGRYIVAMVGYAMAPVVIVSNPFRTGRYIVAA